MPWQPAASPEAPVSLGWHRRLLRPRGLLVAHSALSFAVLYIVLAWNGVITLPSWARVEPANRLSPKVSDTIEPLACVCGALWQHRLRNGVATRMMITGLAAYSRVGSWITLRSVGVRLKAQVGASTPAVARNVSSTLAASGGAGAHPPGRNVCFRLAFIVRVLNSSGSSRTVAGSSNVRSFWAYMLPLVEVGPPSPDCVGKCMHAFDEGAWPGYGGGTALDKAFRALSLLDGVAALACAAWTLVMAARLENVRRFASEEEYLAMGAQVWRGLRRVTAAQWVLAASFAAGFSAARRSPISDDGEDSTSSISSALDLRLLLACVAMEVAGHSITLLAVSLVSTVACSLCCILAWMAWLTKVSVGAFFRFVRLAITEGVVDGVAELSLASSRSFSGSGNSDAACGEDDDTCAICLSALHQVSHNVRVVAGCRTALERVRPRFRPSVSRDLTQVRTRLMRLSRCQHAFHAACFECGMAQLSPRLRRCCPTCRAPNELWTWRRSRLRFGDVLEFIGEELDAELVGVALVLIVILVVSVVTIELSTRWVATMIWLHQNYGVPWPVLNLPLSAAVLFQLFSHLQTNQSWVWTALFMCAVPMCSYCWWSAPSTLLAAGVCGMLAYLACS